MEICRFFACQTPYVWEFYRSSYCLCISGDLMQMDGGRASMMILFTVGRHPKIPHQRPQASLLTSLRFFRAQLDQQHCPTGTSCFSFLEVNCSMYIRKVFFGLCLGPLSWSIIHGIFLIRFFHYSFSESSRDSASCRAHLWRKTLKEICAASPVTMKFRF